MKIGPKFKIAKRLGAPIFEKTQTQKFALSEARAGKRRTGRRPAQASDFKKQLIEKQKMRFSYGISEKQLRRYVTESVAKGDLPIQTLFERLESRLDNAVYRLGLAPTRQASRQMVSHGHVMVNGKRMTVPSHQVRVTDEISVRTQSKDKGLFSTIAEDHSQNGVPSWLTFDLKALTGTVKGTPVYEPSETLFDPELVLEYYSR